MPATAQASEIESPSRRNSEVSFIGVLPVLLALSQARTEVGAFQWVGIAVTILTCVLIQFFFGAPARPQAVAPVSSMALAQAALNLRVPSFANFICASFRKAA